MQQGRFSILRILRALPWWSLPVSEEERGAYVVGKVRAAAVDVIDVHVVVHATGYAHDVVQRLCVPIKHHQNANSTFASVKPDYVL